MKRKWKKLAAIILTAVLCVQNVVVYAEEPVSSVAEETSEEVFEEESVLEESSADDTSIQEEETVTEEASDISNDDSESTSDVSEPGISDNGSISEDPSVTETGSGSEGSETDTSVDDSNSDSDGSEIMTSVDDSNSDSDGSEIMTSVDDSNSDSDISETETSVDNSNSSSDVSETETSANNFVSENSKDTEDTLSDQDMNSDETAVTKISDNTDDTGNVTDHASEMILTAEEITENDVRVTDSVDRAAVMYGEDGYGISIDLAEQRQEGEEIAADWYRWYDYKSGYDSYVFELIGHGSGGLSKFYQAGTPAKFANEITHYTVEVDDPSIATVSARSIVRNYPSRGDQKAVQICPTGLKAGTEDAPETTLATLTVYYTVSGISVEYKYVTHLFIEVYDSDPDSNTGPDWTVNWMKGFGTQNTADTEPVKTETVKSASVPDISQERYPLDSTMQMLRDDSEFIGWDAPVVNETDHVITITAKWETTKACNAYIGKLFEGINFGEVPENFHINCTVTDLLTGNVLYEDELVSPDASDSEDAVWYHWNVEFNYIQEHGFEITCEEFNYEITGYNLNTDTIHEYRCDGIATPFFTNSITSNTACTWLITNKYEKIEYTYTLIYHEKVPDNDDTVVTNMPDPYWTRTISSNRSESLKITETIPIRDGYRFRYWQWGGGNGPALYPGENFSMWIPDNCTGVGADFYAVWLKDPVVPTHQDVSDLIDVPVTVVCDTGEVKDKYFGYTGHNMDRIEIGKPVYDNTGSYTCDVKFLADKFCDAYNRLLSAIDIDKSYHLSENQDDVTVTFTWDADEQIWKLPDGFEAPVVIHVTHESGEYPAKDQVNVTFKVENGSWNDGDRENITEVLNLSSDGTAVLGNMIPPVGDRPDTSYEPGGWDNIPTEDTRITEDTVYTYTYQPIHVHDYMETGNSRDPDCIHEGLKVWKCSCGETKEETIPALGHDFSTAAVTDNCSSHMDPNCTGHTMLCIRCGNTTRLEGYLKTEGHEFGDWIVDVPATMSTNGLRHRICGLCGHLEKEIIPASNLMTEFYHTVTYTDGVKNEEIFKDQVTDRLIHGSVTPMFDGTPERTGYVFVGWDPVVSLIVTGDAVYTAQWKPVSDLLTPEDKSDIDSDLSVSEYSEKETSSNTDSELIPDLSLSEQSKNENPNMEIIKTREMSNALPGMCLSVGFTTGMILLFLYDRRKKKAK